MMCALCPLGSYVKLPDNTLIGMAKMQVEPIFTILPHIGSVCESFIVLQTSSSQPTGFPGKRDRLQLL